MLLLSTYSICSRETGCWSAHLVFAFGVADGKQRWNSSVKGSALSVPLGDTTVLVVRPNQVSALDVANGRQSGTRPVEPRSPDAMRDEPIPVRHHPAKRTV